MRGSESIRGYRIGHLTDRTDPAESALRIAAERLHHQLVAGADPAGLTASRVDFVLDDRFGHSKTPGVPSFAIIQRVGLDILEDQDALCRLAEHDGYLTVSSSVPRLVPLLGPADQPPKPIGFFAETPEVQFLECQIARLIGLSAIRLGWLDSGERTCPVLVEALSGRPYLRIWNRQRNGAERSPQSLFASCGIGLVPPPQGAEIDPATLRRLCEIVSVGAIALCPDTPWIRRHFDDRVWYYPAAAAAGEVAAAIDRAIAEIGADPAGTAARAAAARSIFEGKLAAEAMLRNAIGLYEEWRAGDGARRGPAAGIKVVVDRAAIEPVFERLPDRTLAEVARATAVLRPLQRVPGWRWGGFTEDCDLAVHVRHALWAAGSARGGGLPVVVPWYHGTRLKLHLDNDLSRTLFAGGCFEPNEFALLDRVLRPGMVFVDGGANEGVYTIFAAARVGAEGRVIAVEPSRRELARLRANLALNRMGRVEVVAAALADRPGPVRLMIAEPEHAGQNTLGALAYEGHAVVGTETVPAITLDDLAAQRRLVRLDVLKLDVEGAELRVLSAAQRVLAELRPLILMEVLEPALNHQGGSAAALFELLEAAGYVLFSFARSGEPVPLRETDEPPSDNIVAVPGERERDLLA